MILLFFNSKSSHAATDILEDILKNDFLRTTTEIHSSKIRKYETQLSKYTINCL
jgi:hypothetical protein